MTGVGSDPYRPLPEPAAISGPDIAPTKNTAVCVRLAPDELAMVQALAARTGQSVPAFIRTAVHFLAAADAAYFDREITHV